MRCPYCNSTDSRVTDSRPDTEDAIIRRRRVCEQCGQSLQLLNVFKCVI